MFFQLHVRRGKRLEQSFTLSMCDTEPFSLHGVRCGEVICSTGCSYIDVLRASHRLHEMPRATFDFLLAALLQNVQTACGPTRRPVQWVLGFFLRGKSGRAVKLTIHLHLLPKLKNEWSCTSSQPISFHGVGSENYLFYLLHFLPSPITSLVRCDLRISLDSTCGIGTSGGLTTRLYSYFTVPVTEFDIHLTTL